MQTLVAAAVALLVACGQGETPAPAEAPAGDIILVTIDTWRADAAGFAGNAKVKTPFLDSLARRGVVFANAHAHNVVTLPSHANILTGLNPYQHGVRENAGYTLDEKIETVAERLRTAGYATGAFVAAFPLDARYNLDQGFEVYDDNYGKGRSSLDFAVQERPAPAVLQSAAAWWRSVQGRKRFMWIHLYDPHAPYAPPEPFAAEYRGSPYHGEVAATDHALATHLAPLLADDTSVIVTADHGEALGDHGEQTHGLFAYEATLKVPLIVVAPGVSARVEPAYVRHIDIAPTIFGRAHVQPPEGLPGQSLLQPIAKVDTYFESLSTALNRGWAPLTGIIRDGLKFIELPMPELYDLAADPAEARNVYADRRRESAAARKALEALDAAPAAERSVSTEEAARLRSLGYVAGASPARFTAADDPKNLVHVDAQIHQVIDLYQQGRLEDAVRVARELVREHPRMAAGQELFAFVLQESERVGEAIEVLSGIVKAGQGTNATKAQLGKLLTETGRAGEALAILAPVASGSSDADVLNAYGIALSESGKIREAVAQFRRAIELDPNNAPAYQNLGIAALHANEPAAAEQQLTRALQLNARLPLALNAMGVVYMRRGDAERARDSWRRSFAIDRRQYDALFNLGLVSLRSGDREEARRALTEFVRIAPPARYSGEIATARKALAAIR